MSRLRFNPVWAKAALGALLLALATGASACDEDGKTAPAACLDPALQIYDIQKAGAPTVDNPCVTPIGHSINSKLPPTSMGGTSGSGGKTSGGQSNAADAGAGGAADAGAGGA
jgi:hypothetical protein